VVQREVYAKQFCMQCVLMSN